MDERDSNQTIAIRHASDIVVARQRGRDLAVELGFSVTEATLIATAISELSRNMVLYAKGGEIQLAIICNGSEQGILIVAQDDGPGIADLRRALTGGFSTSGGLGLGLSGVRRLMDDIDVQTAPGRGTTVTTRKWLK